MSVAERIAGRPLARPTPSNVHDALRRAGHVVRHARPGTGGDVFNLDLHVGVVADARTHLERRGLSLVDWTLSGHSWTVGRSRDPVAIVNDRTWFSFSARMARRFRRLYGPYLRSFRGFVAAYPPCFALLYEGLDRPTLAIAAIRYEWPFTSFGSQWDWLDERLRAGVEDGWLTLTANNKADADYLELYTGLSAAHVPSACTYTGLTYTGRRAPVVLATGDTLATSIAGELRHEALPLRAGLGPRHSRADLYDHRAIVLIPYNVSTMALFEHYTACVPLYVPAPAFLKDLMQRHPEDVLSELSFSQVTGKPPARRAGPLDLNDVSDEAVVDWYLDRADFYDRDWMPSVRTFESWEHLDDLLADEDAHAVSAEMAAGRSARLDRIDALWDALPWTEAMTEHA